MVGKKRGPGVVDALRVDDPRPTFFHLLIDHRWKPARRINEIVLGKRGISPDTSLRLSRYFGLTEAFWINLQTRYDLEVQKDKLAGRLAREVRIYQPAGPSGR